MNIIKPPRLHYDPLSTKDLSAACTFLHERHCSFYRQHLPVTQLRNNTRETFMRHLERRSSSTWVARQGRKLVGLIVVTANCIDDLWVAERFQRRGIGKQLLTTAIEHISNRGYGSAQAGIEDFNLPARWFFQQLGWRIIGSEHISLDRHKQVEALVFSLTLTKRANA